MYPKNQTLAVKIEEVSQVGEARRQATSMAAVLGFEETMRGAISLVVTEAANNLLRHAGRGELLLTPVQQGTRAGLEMLALDQGPGMANVRQCLQDGYSTAGTPGTGLGAITRMANEVDIHSGVGVGTALLARFWIKAAFPATSHDTSHVSPSDSTRLKVGAVCVPYPGEHVCGDTWAMRPAESVEPDVFLMADGLGHGPSAAEASREAASVFLAQSSSDPAILLEAMHAGMRHTRGAAAAIARLDCERLEVRFAGAGNISAAIVSGRESRSLVSHNGTVGHQIRKIQEFVYPYAPGALLILHSDGISTHWGLEKYPGLFNRDVSLIAGVLYRDFCRGRDDASVLVIRTPLAEEFKP